jgi:replication-associated recombination protein RarA
MKDSILLHPQTEQLIALYSASPTGAVVLSGPEGSGKEFAAQHIALHLLGLTDRTSLQKYPYWLPIYPDGSTIGIEAIRSVQNDLRLSLPKGMRRVVSIIDAHTMTTEAQNALLKTLEEPPSQTFIVLTTDKADALLPTIRSRLQIIPVQPPSAAAITQYFAERGTEAAPQHVALARGRIGLLDALSTDNSHPLSSSISLAKELVGASTFERLAMTDTLLKQKDQLQHVLDGMAIIYRALISSNAKSGKESIAIQCAERLARVLDTQEQLRRSVQAKLALDTLFLHI